MTCGIWFTGSFRLSSHTPVCKQVDSSSAAAVHQTLSKLERKLSGTVATAAAEAQGRASRETSVQKSDTAGIVAVLHLLSAIKLQIRRCEGLNPSLERTPENSMLPSEGVSLDDYPLDSQSWASTICALTDYLLQGRKFVACTGLFPLLVLRADQSVFSILAWSYNCYTSLSHLSPQ